MDREFDFRNERKEENIEEKTVKESIQQENIQKEEEVEAANTEVQAAIKENIQEKAKQEKREDFEEDFILVDEEVQKNDKEEERGSKRGRKPSFVKRVGALVASAAIFGMISGPLIFGINYYLGKRYQSTSNVIIGRNYNTAGTVSVQSNGDVSTIVEDAMPSVVAINATSTVSATNFFGQSRTYQTEGSGSGIIIGKNDTELLIVTNNHVVERSTELGIVFIDGSEVQALVKGGDSGEDIAVVSVKLADIPKETLEKIEVAKIGDSNALKVGQGVVAIGNALGYGQSVTVGYVSALDREVHIDENTTKNLLQTDAAINPGNSGGALLNMAGELIGINSAKYSSTEVEGMGYAIPISKVSELIEELSVRQTRETVAEEKRGYLGIQGQDIDANIAAAYNMPRGIYIASVIEGGSAQKAGLQERDIITKFDDLSIQSMAELKEALTYYEAGESVNITVNRLENGEYVEKEIEITLGNRESLE